MRDISQGLLNPIATRKAWRNPNAQLNSKKCSAHVSILNTWIINKDEHIQLSV
jgi:hypothetical protein